VPSPPPNSDARPSRTESAPPNPVAPESSDVPVVARDLWRRHRWLLLGIGVSLPLHLTLMVWLAAVVISRPAAVASSVRGVEVALLPESALDRMLETRLPELTQPAIDAPQGENDLLDLPDQPVAGGTTGAVETGGWLTTGGDDPLDGSGTGTGRGDPGLGSGAGGTSFFGVRARGTRFGYVIDKSGSMAHDGRWQRLADELLRSLRELPEAASFSVVFFDTSANAFPPASQAWERARRSGVERFVRWARHVGPGGGTEPIYGFNHLLSLDVPPDAIFFMTDGEIPPEQATSTLAKVMRRARPIAIHCILFQDRAPALIPAELRLRAEREIDARVAQSKETGDLERLVRVALDLSIDGTPRDLASAMRERLNERILRTLASETGGAFRLIPIGGGP